MSAPPSLWKFFRRCAITAWWTLRNSGKFHSRSRWINYPRFAWETLRDEEQDEW